MNIHLKHQPVNGLRERRNVHLFIPLGRCSNQSQYALPVNGRSTEQTISNNATRLNAAPTALNRNQALVHAAAKTGISRSPRDHKVGVSFPSDTHRNKR